MEGWLLKRAETLGATEPAGPSSSGRDCGTENLRRHGTALHHNTGAGSWSRVSEALWLGGVRGAWGTGKMPERGSGGGAHPRATMFSPEDDGLTRSRG